MEEFLRIAEITVPLLLQGLVVTIEISILAIVFSIIVGFLICCMCLSKNKLIEAIARIYIKIFRCTPFMVQVYLAYYGLPSLGIKVSAFWIGVAVMSAYNAAYIAVIFESGIRSIPKGQSEAAAAIGMGYFKTLFRILLPQTIGVILPPLTGQFLQTVKDTSILSIITVTELTMMTKKAIGVTFAPLFVYLLAGALYWVINIGIELVTKKIEKKNKLLSI